MKAVFNTHLHLHWDNFSSPFDLLIWQQYSKIDLFYNTEFSGNNHSNKVSDSTSNALEGLIFFLKVRKFEVELLVFSHDTSRFEFFGEGGEFCAQIFVGKYF